MFEQSLILNDGISRKTGAFAASLTAQSLFVGVCIVVPLFYSEVLPVMKSTPPLALPVFLKPLPVEVIHTPISQEVRVRNPFLAPAKVPTRHVTAEPIQLDAAPSVNAIYDPNASIFATNAPPASILSATQVPAPPTLVKPEVHPVEIAPPSGPVRMTSDVQAAKILKKVLPVYPPIARTARVSGTVRLQGIIARDGTIQNLQALSGHPLLIQAALEAVRQWVYRPTILNGQPVEVIAPIDVIFTLSN
jgi:protein TonB